MQKEEEKFNRILQDIKDIKIQGAENVAKAGMNAFILQSDRNSVNRIIKTRPTEPLMQNSLACLSKSKNPKKSQKKILNYLKESQIKMAKKGASLIKKDMNIYVHCHSSTVINILKLAKKQKKNFTVYTSEVEPILQGRMTAEDLAKSKMKVIIVPDMAAGQFIKNCDLFLFGADAFTKDYLANKIGTQTLCEIAKDFKIQTYSCGVSLKYTKKIKMEFRKTSELWEKKDKNIQIINPAFDKVDSKLLTGVISEFGILPYKEFILRAKKNLENFLNC